MKLNFYRGFTLIELLVVIAIIGVLSAVVLGSLSSARTKGNDTAIKSDLSSIRSQAELYFDAGNTYGATAHAEGACLSAATGNIIGNTNIRTMIDHANTTAGGTIPTSSFSKTRCAVSATSWAVAVTLKGDTTKAWCVDSLGSSRQIAGPAESTATAIVGDGSLATPFACAVGA